MGVAFGGKRPPKSFAVDPLQRYDIAKPSNEASFGAVTEESGERVSEVNITDKQKETRHSIPIEVLVEVFDEKGELSIKEKSVTENISQFGAAVFKIGRASCRERV